MKRNIKVSIKSGFENLLLIAIIVAGSLWMGACGKSDKTQISEAAQPFADTYFNWQFPKAVSYCTSESRQWLSYLSSQVNQQDVDTLRAMTEGARCEVDGIDIADNDSTATVNVQVHHYLSMDTLGQTGHIIEKSKFIIPMVRRNSEWKVSPSSPLRAEKE